MGQDHHLQQDTFTQKPTTSALLHPRKQSPQASPPKQRIVEVESHAVETMAAASSLAKTSSTSTSTDPHSPPPLKRTRLAEDRENSSHHVNSPKKKGTKRAFIVDSDDENLPIAKKTKAENPKTPAIVNPPKVPLPKRKTHREEPKPIPRVTVGRYPIATPTGFISKRSPERPAAPTKRTADFYYGAAPDYSSW